MMSNLKRMTALGAAALLLAACGGSDREDADPLAAVPASASESPQALVNYIDQLAPLDAEAREPFSLEGFVPPTSDDTEPQEPAGG